MSRPARAGTPWPPVRPAEDDRFLLGQIRWIAEGEAGKAARKQAWYAAYIATLMTAVYAFPVTQALFATTDHTTLAAVLRSPVVGLGGLVLVGLTLGAVYRIGLQRGPITPSLPYLQFAAGTDLDRAIVLRGQWVLALAMALFGGGLAGLCLGGALAFAQVMGWPVVIVGVVVGLALGRVVAWAWLLGQGRSRPEDAVGPWVAARPAEALRALPVDVIRQHSSTSTAMAMASYSGDLRSLRMLAAGPITRGRQRVMRAGSPILTMVRRDALGLRRTPGASLAGTYLLLVGIVLILPVAGSTSMPIFFATIGAVLAYAGFGQLCEGLRLQADAIGLPSLLGISRREEALAHLAVPTLRTLAISLLVGGWLVVLNHQSVFKVGATAVAVLLVLAAAHTCAAFRGSPPEAVRLGQPGGPTGYFLWYAIPLLGSILAVTIFAFAFAHGSTAALNVGYVILAGLAVYANSRIKA